MPDVKVYIRSEDLDKWKAIEKKAEFIHVALNQRQPADHRPLTSSDIQELGLTLDKATNKAVSQGFKPCKHGSDPNFCKFAKPGKPCKT